MRCPCPSGTRAAPSWVGTCALLLLFPRCWKSSVAPSSVWAPKQLAAIDRAIASALQPGDPVDLSQLWDAAATDLAVQFACKTDAVAGQRVYARVAQCSSLRRARAQKKHRRTVGGHRHGLETAQLQRGARARARPTRARTPRGCAGRGRRCHEGHPPPHVRVHVSSRRLGGREEKFRSPTKRFKSLPK